MKNDGPDLAFLTVAAINAGATEAIVISARDIVVEDRVALKCRFGCDEYGKRWTCPPVVPTVEEFRRMLNDYQHAILIKFTSLAVADEEIAGCLLRCQYDPALGQDLKEKSSKFWSDWKEDQRRVHLAVLELERIAFASGFTFATGFISGPCSLCEKCNVTAGKCLHPTMARSAEHAVGVNMKKTAEKAGIPLAFPFRGKPEPMALLLVD
jgi:predicted metal-binding protein